MNIDLRELIDTFVNELIKVYDIKYPIDNINAIIEKMGGKVEYISNLSEDGHIIKVKDGFIIKIFKRDYIHIERYTSAQSLGILFLEMGYHIDQQKWENSRDYVCLSDLNFKQIWDINYFAGAFLMPEKLFREKVDELTDGDSVYTKELAEYFHVSVTQASNRGIDLGLFRKW